MNIYYVYAYFRKEDNTPYYIGKGKGDRAYQKSHRVKVPVDRSRIAFLHTDLSEEDAYRLEEHYINLYGRVDLGTGILRNVTKGGEGARNPSADTRKRLSEVQRGKKASDETRRKMSETKLGPKNHRYGKPMSDEAKRKLSETKKGKPSSPDANEKRRKWNLENNWRPPNNKGKTYEEMHGPDRADELKARSSAVHKGKIVSEETRKKISEAKKRNNSLRDQR